MDERIPRRSKPGEGKPIGHSVDLCLLVTEAEVRKRERAAFVAGWEDVLETDFDDEMRLLAEVEAARRWPEEGR